MHVAKTYEDLIEEARETEQKDPETAIRLYQRAVKQEPHVERAYNRLMIIFRKEKMYKEELDLINKGIKEFEAFYAERSKKIIGKNAKAVQLSNALAKSLGLRDQKGSDQVLREPITSWVRRRAMVEKKLGIEMKGQRSKVKKSQVKGERSKVKKVASKTQRLKGSARKKS